MALASTFKRYTTIIEYLSKKYHNNEVLKKIRDAAISMFCSYCEAQISISPPMRHKEKGDEVLRYHHSVRIMNSGIELLY